MQLGARMTAPAVLAHTIFIHVAQWRVCGGDGKSGARARYGAAASSTSLGATSDVADYADGMDEPLRIIIYSDYVCPWCYIGHERIGRLVRRWSGGRLSCIRRRHGTARG